MNADFLTTPYYQQQQHQSWSAATQSSQVPIGYTLPQSGDMWSTGLQNSQQQQHPQQIFGGLPVTQTILPHSTEEVNPYATGASVVTPPGYYGWSAHSLPSIHHASSQSPSSDEIYNAPNYVMTPEPEVDSAFTRSSPMYATATSQAYFPMIPPHAVAPAVSYIKSSPPSSPSLLISPVSDAAELAMRMRRKSVAEEITQTHMVKLTRMSPERIEHIKGLAEEKGINPHTVEAVLTLYTPSGRRHYLQNIDQSAQQNHQVYGDDIYINITMNGGYSDDDFTAPLNKKKSTKNSRKSRPDYVKRPLNSFMLYRKSQTQSAMAYAVHSQLKLNHQNISQIIGLMWQTESKEVKDQFARFAGKEKELHRVLHPDYKFCPQKKKRKEIVVNSSIIF